MRDGHMAQCESCFQIKKKKESQKRKEVGDREELHEKRGERERDKKVFFFCFFLRSMKIGS